MTKIIGLTGGIGSGKTTIAKMFEQLGVPVYIADVEAKKIMELPEVLQSIKLVFGDEVFDEDKLNRKKLSEIVFKDSVKLTQLNQIVHPLVKAHFDKWILDNNNHSFVLKEAAILFESGSYKDCDKIITVSAPLENRIKRVVERDFVESNSVLDRVSNQWTDQMREKLSDFVIINIDKDLTKKKVFEIYEDLMKQLNT